jgi:DsbC/DsbD-like thiol-disulfide interchange protein
MGIGRILAGLAGTWLLCGAAAPAGAIDSPWTRAAESTVRLVVGAPADGERELRGAVEIRLTRGWHTYWRYPGDAGIPPRFDWAASDNVAAVDLRWPAPVRIVTKDGTQSIGYEDGVVFPLRIRPADPKRPVKLALKLEFAVCERLCIPAEAEMRLEVRGSVGKVPLLDEADARVPRKARLSDAPGLSVLSVRLERGPKPRALVEIKAPAGSDPDLFAEGPTEAWALSLPEKVAGEAGRVRFAIPLEGAPPGADPIPLKLRLTLVAGREAIEIEAPLD